MTRKHRRHSTARKREVVEAHFNGESMRGLSHKFDVCRTLIPVWVEKYGRQIAPGRRRARQPQDRVDETPIVHAAPSGSAPPSRNKRSCQGRSV